MTAMNMTAISTNHHRSAESRDAQVKPGPEPGPGPTPAPYFRWKGAVDRVLAAVLLILGLPLIALLVAIVWLTSRGPGIYRQRRVGKDRRKFMIYKIRTMRHDAEAHTGPVWTQARDPRVTLIGRVFRKLHLDELPQLINVLRGEMSLVGPRPERPEFVRVLGDAIPEYSHRLAVRPGVTGLAQLNLPPDSDLDGVRRKLALDLEYIAHASLWLDVRLLLCTFLRMFKIPERYVIRFLGLRHHVTLPVEHASAGGAPAVAPTPAEIREQAAAEARSNGKRHHRPRRHPKQRSPR